MGRPRRTPRAPAGDRQAAARAPEPRAGATPLLAGVIALLALRVLAALLPGRSLWGLDLGRDLAPVSFAVGLAVTLVACAPPVFGAIARVWPTSRGATAVVAVASAMALGIFMHAHPDLTLWTGDTAIRHGEFTTVERPEEIAKQATRGDLFLHHTLPRALASATGASAEDVGRVQGALLAFLTALAGFRLAETLGARGLPAFAVAAVAASSAALALDNGYAKATVELACVTTLLAPSLVRLATEGAPGGAGSGLGSAGVLVALALLLHRSALALLPVWLVGAWLALRSGRGSERTTWLGLALPLLSLALVGPQAWRVFTGFDLPFHLTARGTTAPFSTALAPGHLVDVANVLVLLCPLLPLLPLLFALAPRPSPREGLVMAAFTIPPAVLVLLIPPQQGLARDWDVFAFTGSALAAVAAWRVAVLLRARASGAGLSLALAALVPALQWAALPFDANRAMARAESLLVGPPAREREEAAQGLATLGMSRYVRGDPDGARRLFQLSLDRSPHPRMLVQWGMLANMAGRPAEALEYFRRSTTINPGLAMAWQGVAESAAALGDTTNLAEAIVALERLEPEGASLKAARERLAALRAR